MNATNLNIVLTNSLCCISTQAVKVSKLYSIGDFGIEGSKNYSQEDLRKSVKHLPYTLLK